MKILGVYFSNGHVSVESDNWKSKLDKLQNVVNLERSLSSMSWALAAFGTLPRSSFTHSGLLIRIIRFSGLLCGNGQWKMLVVSVVARRFVTAASTL